METPIIGQWYPLEQTRFDHTYIMKVPNGSIIRYILFSSDSEEKSTSMVFVPNCNFTIKENGAIEMSVSSE